MNIYLPADLRKAWEGSWIKFLLGDLYYSAEYYEDSDFPIVNNSFYVTLYNTDYKKSIKSMIERKYTFGIFLLSDEFLTDKCEYVSEPECKFVIRNYIHPNLYQNPKVVHIGLGFKKNFDKYVQKNEFIERGYTWNFIGSVHGNSRNQAVNVFSHLDAGFIHKTKHFNSDDYLSTEEYCEVLSQSLYTICPQGHANNETFRIFEALEAGSIPVVLKNSEAHPFNPGYWNYLFTGEPFFPFVVADDWESARHTVTTDIKNGLTALRQKQCQLFWSKWKATWKYQLHAKLSSLA